MRPWPFASPVATIPPGVPFVDSLAEGLLLQATADPLALSDVTVLLPTRRACRSLREAFLRRGGGRPLLLPRLRPIGDLDIDELTLAHDEGADGSDLEIPPTIAGLRRQLVLARLILRVPNLAATPAQAARLGLDLARFLDQVQTERLAFEGLNDLVPEDHAAHWQITLRFLGILTTLWPEIAAEEGAVDPVIRREKLLAAQAWLWQQSPPPGPVIAAGSTGSIPATRDLLAVVAGLPNGLVVLPGLDRTCDPESWACLEETHPQFGLKRLLERLGLAREQVADWTPLVRPADPARARLLSETARPAATTDRWRDQPIAAAACDGLVRIDCPDAQEEAAVIALLLRQTLEMPDQTALLVTPDRALARRVAGHLQRWGVAIDDSAGLPLAETAAGTYLRLIAAWALNPSAPVTLLALLKHPLAAGAEPTALCRARVRALERVILRGPAPPPGLDGLISVLDHADPDRFDRSGLGSQAALRGWFQSIVACLEPLAAGLTTAAPLVDLLRAHVAAAEALAATDQETGAERLWRHADGEAAAAFVHELSAAAIDFPTVDGGGYPALFETFLTGRRVRPAWGTHPRVAILGPLEARLLGADRIILGGLNEGTWPTVPAPDPWLSRPMRHKFGLPAPERQIGLSAHDFAQLAAGPSVYLTRAERVDGAPTVPSRWLLRLETVLRASGLEGRIELESPQWLAWARALDHPHQVRPIPSPTPRPPVEARPRTLSATRIETWMRDPYAIYAQKILKLTKLDPICADPGAAERGQFIHEALDHFISRHRDALPDPALPVLLEIGRASLARTAAGPDLWAFWWPRFERIAQWFLAVERERRAGGTWPAQTEVKGQITLSGLHGPFTLTATADRIDRLPGGGLAIIDYKTGVPPSAREVELGYAPQLPLEAVIAMAAGFNKVAPAEVAELSYWRLNGGDPAGETRPIKGDLRELAARTRRGLENLIATFDNPETPYHPRPRPEHAPRYSDYEHLARVQEWSAGGEAEA